MIWIKKKSKTTLEGTPVYKKINLEFQALELVVREPS